VTSANDRHSGPTIVPVILSGGSGTRLWPFSTEETPKQFLSFTGTENLFQLTLDRVKDRQRFASPIVVGSVRHVDFCEQELDPEDEQALLILEPCARNTAAAIVMAATAAREAYGDDILLLVMPSDHMMQEVAEFHAAVRIGEVAARAGHLVTFGIHPTGPDTGFGYLESGDDLPHALGVREVVRFVEKPKLETAEEMVADGRHL
jgi:mannose-1-phosphate guanylyltransferase/mannose-1-phosphate guanylyltransferase/mannose-6-phosphate isomerase